MSRLIAGRLISALAVSLGLASGAGAAPDAKSISPEVAPPAWNAYAGQVNTAVAGWLGGEEEAAQRLRAYVDATRPADDQASEPVVIKLWIDPKGVIERIDFASFAHEEVNASLRALLVGRMVGAPPKDMLFPLRLGVQLVPQEPATAVG